MSHRLVRRKGSPVKLARVLLLSWSVVVASGCGLFAAQGDGNKITEVREVTAAFSRVDNDTPLDVVIHRGQQAHLEVTLDANLQEYLRLTIAGDTLTIDTTDPIQFQGVGRVDVALPQLTFARLSGSGSITADGAQEPTDLALELTGSGEVDVCGGMIALRLLNTGTGALVACSEDALGALELRLTGSGDVLFTGEVGDVDAGLSGTGNATLLGHASQLEAEVSGTGTLNARDLVVAGGGALVSSGTGDLLATFNAGTVSVELTGSGDVEVWGDATVVTGDLGGTGRFVRH